MKNLVVLFYLLSCFGCKVQSQNDVEVIGSWKICVSQANGVQEHPNHCPEITFFSNHIGVLEASDPSSKFQWKISNGKVYFSFQSSYDKENFLSKKEEFKFELSDDANLKFLKLIDETSGAWFLLSKKK